jgi:hypothetical protein
MVYSIQKEMTLYGVSVMKKFEFAVAAAIIFALGYYAAIKIAEFQMIVDV